MLCIYLIGDIELFVGENFLVVPSTNSLVVVGGHEILLRRRLSQKAGGGAGMSVSTPDSRPDHPGTGYVVRETKFEPS